MTFFLSVSVADPFLAFTLGIEESSSLGSEQKLYGSVFDGSQLIC